MHFFLPPKMTTSTTPRRIMPPTNFSPLTLMFLLPPTKTILTASMYLVPQNFPLLRRNFTIELRLFLTTSLADKGKYILLPASLYAVVSSSNPPEDSLRQILPLPAFLFQVLRLSLADGRRHTYTSHVDFNRRICFPVAVHPCTLRFFPRRR